MERNERTVNGIIIVRMIRTMAVCNYRGILLYNFYRLRETRNRRHLAANFRSFSCRSKYHQQKKRNSCRSLFIISSIFPFSFVFFVCFLFPTLLIFFRFFSILLILQCPAFLLLLFRVEFLLLNFTFENLLFHPDPLITPSNYVC